MDQDALTTARRIRQPIAGNDDIANAFDGITYQKGAAVIGMFEGWVGEEGFRQGIQRYLKSHAWGNATADDFVSSIAEAVKNPAVVPAFRSFLDQPGVPLVTVDLRCGGGVPTLVLSQKRFLPTGSTGSSRQTWQVPVCARTGDPGDPDGLHASRRADRLARPAGPVPGACPRERPRRLLPRPLRGRPSREGPRGPRPAPHAGRARRDAVRRGRARAQRRRPDGDGARARPDLRERPGPAPSSRRYRRSRPRRATSSSRTRLRPRYRQFVSDAFGARAHALGWVPKPGEDEDTQLLRAALVPFVANEGDEPALVAQAKTPREGLAQGPKGGRPAPRVGRPGRGRAARGHGALPGLSRGGAPGDGPPGARPAARRARAVPRSGRRPGGARADALGRLRCARDGRRSCAKNP